MVQPIPFRAIGNLLCRMSADDLSELTLLAHGAPTRHIEAAAMNSVASFAACAPQGVVAVGGMTSTGYAWMIASADLGQHKKALLRESRVQLAKWLELFPVVRTRVDERYVKSLRWLKWLGFEPVGEGEFMGRRYRELEARA